MRVAVNGLTHSGPGSDVMNATLQTQAPGGGNQAWVPVSVTSLTANTFGGPDTLWTATITLPAPRGSRPFRLLLEEFEVFHQEWAPQPAGTLGLCRRPESLGCAGLAAALRQTTKMLPMCPVRNGVNRLGETRN